MADLRDELARAMEYGMAHRPDPEGAPGHDLNEFGYFGEGIPEAAPADSKVAKTLDRAARAKKSK